MKPKLPDSWDTDTLETRARWCQSLAIQERLALFEEWCEAALEADPGLLERRKHFPHAKRVLYLSLDGGREEYVTPQEEESK